MPRSPLSAFFLTSSLLFAGVTGGTLAGQEAAARVQDPYAPIDTLLRVLTLVERTWVDEVTTEALVNAALQGMIASLDAHSVWMPAEGWQTLQQDTKGEFFGFGVEVQWGGQGAEIVGVLDGSPAGRLGLRSGDLILAIDGEPLTPADLQRDAPGSLSIPEVETTLTILRPGWDAPRELTTQREVLRQPSVYAERIDGAIAWIRIDQFREGSAAALKAALLDLLDGGGLRGLVLDLRDNPGGLLREAIASADVFLPGGDIVRTEGRQGQDLESWEATAPHWDGALAVLVNGRSASGSEVVAAALQDRGRAVLVGTPTYGKGSVQSVFEHRDGSALKLTVGRYLTPSGAPVADRQGRAPDVQVPWPDDTDPRVRLREQIEQSSLAPPERRALLALVDDLPDVEQRRRKTSIPWGVPVRDRLALDPQLRAAVAWLRERLPDHPRPFIGED